MNDIDTTFNPSNKFKIQQVTGGNEYICEMCHDFQLAVIVKALFDDGGVETIYLNYNELSLPMINKTTTDMSSYSFDIKVIRMCDKCYRRLVLNISNMAIVNIQNKIQKN